jgi:hypothetical protein
MTGDQATAPVVVFAVTPMLELAGRAAMALGERKYKFAVHDGGRLTILPPRSRADLKIVRKENPQCP